MKIAPVILWMEDISEAYPLLLGRPWASAGMGETGLVIGQDHSPKRKKEAKTFGKHQEGAEDTTPVEDGRRHQHDGGNGGRRGGWLP